MARYTWASRTTSPGAPGNIARALSRVINQYGLTRLVFAEHHDDMRAGRQRERNMKHWRRSWKVRLILDQNPGWADLYDRLS